MVLDHGQAEPAAVAFSGGRNGKHGLKVVRFYDYWPLSASKVALESPINFRLPQIFAYFLLKVTS